jgi:hypothetical protein
MSTTQEGPDDDQLSLDTLGSRTLRGISSCFDQNSYRGHTRQTIYGVLYLARSLAVEVPPWVTSPPVLNSDQKGERVDNSFSPESIMPHRSPKLVRILDR